jgi:hypothetical protein
MNLKPILTGLLASIAVGAIAQTTDPKISLSIASVPETVTISESQQQTPKTYVVYELRLLNGGGSDINLVKIDASVAVSANLSPALIEAAANTGLPTACTIAPSQTAVNCDFSGTAYPSGAELFVPVVVTVPQYLALPPTGNEKLTLSASSTFREGKSINASSSSVGALTALRDTPVAELAFDSLKSAVIKQGGQFFTGKNGLPSAADPFNTRVQFAELPVNYSRVEITEQPFASAADVAKCIGGKHFVTCYSTLLYAPDVVYTSAGGYLTEVIRIHPSNFSKPAAQMDSVLWYYIPTDSTTEYPIGFCASATTPNPANSDGVYVPCQTKPVFCYKKSTPGWTPELDGVCEWTFINRSNGFIKGF